MRYILLFEERELVELFVDAVLLLKKRGGLEERKQVFSGCSTFSLREKQLRVSDQSLGCQSNQATKSQTHEGYCCKDRIVTYPRKYNTTSLRQVTKPNYITSKWHCPIHPSASALPACWTLVALLLFTAWVRFDDDGRTQSRFLSPAGLRGNRLLADGRRAELLRPKVWRDTQP